MDFGFGEDNSDEMDYVDENVEYVSTDANEAPFVPDASISDGTDFDLPLTYPAEPAVPFNESMSVDEMAYTKELEQQYAPTRPIGIAQDVVTLSQQLSQGNDIEKMRALEEFSQKQIAMFTSPKVVGPLLVFWAYRGRLSYVERALLGAVGVGALIKGFGVGKASSTYDHPLMKTVKAKVVP